MFHRLLALLGFLSLFAVSARAEGIVISVYPSVAPNRYGSPSYGPYVSNAIDALSSGLSAYGDMNYPSYYAQQTLIPISQMVVTGFPSWDGLADPGTVFGSAYANELGNRALFGVVIDAGPGAPSISIGELSFAAVSNDPGGLLTFSFGQGSYNYSTEYVGVIFGTGGDPDTYVTSGSSDQLVNEIIGRGSGNAASAYCTGCTTVAQDQAAINATYGSFSGMSRFTGTYTLTGPGGIVLSTGSGAFDVVPEPGTLPVAAAAALALGLALARRRRRTPAP